MPPTIKILRDEDLYARLRDVLERGWISIPDDPGYGGTGAPGKILEKLLGIDGGNFDTPDAGRWEIKFHSQNALLTLFHLEGEPTGHMHDMVREFGKLDAKGRTSFRHTIHNGRSSLGFLITNESGRVTVRHPHVSDIAWPHWTHDRLINAFASKFRRLIVVKGRKRSGMVRYDAAFLYREPKVTSFVSAIEHGIVAIDFDARTDNGSGLRNHGTKFRVKYNDLGRLYSDQKELV